MICPRSEPWPALFTITGAPKEETGSVQSCPLATELTRLQAEVIIFVIIIIIILVWCFVVSFCETSSCCIAQLGLELKALLFQPPEF